MRYGPLHMLSFSCLLVLISQLAHFVLENLDALLGLEVNLLNNVLILDRPTKATAYSEAEMSPVYPHSIKDIHEMIKSVKDFRMSKTAVTCNYWTLDAPTHFDWKTQPKDEIKNAPHDFHKWAAMAYIEECIMKKYRKQLLLKSKAASFLCNAISTTFLPFIKLKKIIVPGTKTTQTVLEYHFADGMKVDPDISKADFDVNEIMSKSNQVVYINAAHTVLESLHRTVKNDKFAKCTPRSTEIASDIAICVKALQRVKSTLLYCPSAAHLLTQAILINAHQLHKMSSAEMDVSINTDDENYKVDPSSIPDLPQVPPMKASKSADGTNMHTKKPTNISEEKDNPPNNSATQHREIKKAAKQADGGGDGDDKEEEEDSSSEEEDDSSSEEEEDSSSEEEDDSSLEEEGDECYESPSRHSFSYLIRSQMDSYYVSIPWDASWVTHGS